MTKTNEFDDRTLSTKIVQTISADNVLHQAAGGIALDHQQCVTFKSALPITGQQELEMGRTSCRPRVMPATVPSIHSTCRPILKCFRTAASGRHLVGRAHLLSRRSPQSPDHATKKRPVDLTINRPSRIMKKSCYVNWHKSVTAPRQPAAINNTFEYLLRYRS